VHPKISLDENPKAAKAFADSYFEAVDYLKGNEARPMRSWALT
jgi:hypothetical protein